MAALRFDAADGVRLSGILHGAVEASSAAVVCHPHPHFGGTMATPLVRRIAEALGEAGVCALRFDFRGVGESDGTSTADRSELSDVAGALDLLAGRCPSATLALVGYSFGAWAAAHAEPERSITRMVLVAPPIASPGWELPRPSAPSLLIVGGDDEHCPPTLAKAWCDANDARLVPLPGADHFLAGHEHRVAGLVVDFVTGG